VPKTTSKISRRHFSRLAAAAAALPFSSGGVLAATHHSCQGVHPVTGLSAAQLADVEAKLANVVRKYGARLTESERQHIRKILVYNETMLASIRSFRLKNGDSPASVLKVSFAEGTTPKEKS
jgi:hypothetical protein